ncbi:superoxide dismutase family protein [Halodurantibacterium flavum]|uniref:Superoxide dismutase [Cu-Zn] n=1 Tax=Halodurantibacterium flavum TaxID=1382802 RepID=A0ABW4S6I7_9RHOB
MSRRFSLSCAGASLAALLVAAPAIAQEASATFLSPDGTELGTATLSEAAEGGVLVTLDVGGLPPSAWVAFHVHETGECDPETDHESAGGHFNPDDSAHGYFAEGGPHAGDMPNQYVDGDGMLRAEVFNSYITLAEGETSVMGRALMIHADPDDYESQPTGDAGDRIACAVIE